MTDAATRCVMIVRTGTGNGGQVRMGAGVQQIVAAHEAGHMFGLGDEYTAPFAGTGGDLGTPVDGDLGQQQGLPGAVHENSDTIMSVGDAVRPQHYATFLEALKAVTEMSEWVFGPPVPVTPPNPALDSIPGQGGVPGRRADGRCLSPPESCSSSSASRAVRRRRGRGGSSRTARSGPTATCARRSRTARCARSAARCAGSA